MKLEYKNGVRLTKLTHEMSPLEMAMARYDEIKENVCHLKGLALNSHCNTVEPETRLETERKAALAVALKHLECEERTLDTMYEVQTQLDEYRKFGLNATKGNNASRMTTIDMLGAEEHHKQNGLKRLEEFMWAEGMPKPSPQHTAHHIVPGKGLLPKINTKTRFHLHKQGIRINDPANGVYLVSKDEFAPHWAMPLSRGHKKYHLHEYEVLLNKKITPIKQIDFIKTQLQIIGQLLQTNEPKIAMNEIRSLRG